MCEKRQLYYRRKLLGKKPSVQKELLMYPAKRTSISPKNPKSKSKSVSPKPSSEMTLSPKSTALKAKAKAKVGERPPQITVITNDENSTAPSQAFLMSNMPAPGSIELEDALIKYGPAPGAKNLMWREMDAAEWSIESGIYGFWRCTTIPLEKPTPGNPHALDFCARIGPKCKCFCGHKFENHDQNPCARKGASTKCHQCECKMYEFVPMRPEEIGDWWLPRRKDFNILTWRVKCKCGHTHEEHKPYPQHFCTKCGCGQWTGNYECMSCEHHQREHELMWMTRDERRAEGLKVDEEYKPLESMQNISQIVFGAPKPKAKKKGG